MRNQSSVCPRNSCAGGYGNCLDVKITNLCNGNCSFCIERGGYSPENQKGPVELLAKRNIRTSLSWAVNL